MRELQAQVNAANAGKAKAEAESAAAQAAGGAIREMKEAIDRYQDQIDALEKQAKDAQKFLEEASEKMRRKQAEEAEEARRKQREREIREADEDARRANDLDLELKAKNLDAENERKLREEKLKREREIANAKAEADKKLKLEAAELQTQMDREQQERDFMQQNEDQLISNAAAKKKFEAMVRSKLLQDPAYQKVLAQEAFAQEKANKKQRQLQRELAKLEEEGKKDRLRQTLNFFSNLTNDPKRLKNIVFSGAGLAALTFLAWKSVGLGAKQADKYLNTPPLVRETSKRSLFQMLFGSNKKKTKIDDIILEPTIEAELKQVAEDVNRARKERINLPNIVLYGPPGTGKTMFIEYLAGLSGMTFAKMTGGDVSQLLTSGGKNEAVTELHKLFDWLEANGPAILLVDEADAFLKKGRSGGKMSEGLAAAINTFLARTGAASRNVMLVFATNNPEVLDEAVASRVSKWLEIGLPNQKERERLLVKYLMSDIIGRKARGGTEITNGGIGEAAIKKLAAQMEGYSGRDISMKFIDELYRRVVTTNDKVVRPEMLESTFADIQKQAARLSQWITHKPDFTDAVHQKVSHGSTAAAAAA